MKKEKIYCEGCNHFSSYHVHQKNGEACLANPLKDGSNYYWKYKRYALPSEKNKNNDCEDFEKKEVIDG